MFEHEDPTRPHYDAALAASFVGKYILIGITYLDSEDRYVGQVQFHGRITSADPMEGFHVDLEGARAGETHRIPPDPSAIRPAPPGEYRLRSTGEVVRDPDLLTTWTSRKGKPRDGGPTQHDAD